jgi:flagellar basal-body rod protein FlgG
MKSLHIAASGMAAQQSRLDTVANNIANVGTTGFKRSRGAFEDLLYQEVATSTGEQGARAEVGGGVRMAGLERDHRQGSLGETGNPLHVALSGRGFFVLEHVDGTPVYTRDGTFAKAADGTLVNSAGLRVGGDVVLPDDVNQVVIGQDGTVRGVTGDGEEIVLGEIEIAVFENTAGLRSLGGNLYAETPESGEADRWEAGRDGAVQQGFLEQSNVDVANELIALIEAQRAYELNSKVVKAADEAMQVAANLKR